MAALRKPRYELFAQGLAQGFSQTKAAIEAGFAESDAAARGCRLAKRPEIKARVAELQPRIAKQTEITTNISKAWMIQELQDLLSKAKAEKQFATAAKCVIDIGKVAGVYSERPEANDALIQVLGVVIATGDISGLSDEHLENFRRAVRKLAEMPRQIEGAQGNSGLAGDASDSGHSNGSSASAPVVDLAPAAEIPVPRQPAPIAGNSAPASRQLTAADNNGGGGAVAGEPERIEAPKVDVAGDENSPEKQFDVTVGKIPASDLPVQRPWLPIWRKLLPQRETDPGTFDEEMARLAPGFNPRPAFWPLGIEAQAAALDERFPLGK